MTDQKVAKPFLKWAGGKKQLLPVLNENYPKALDEGEIDVYVEPFLGGGAVLFDILNNFKVNKVIANDINRDLIITYKVVRDYCEHLITLLKLYEIEYLGLSDEDRKTYYYQKRELYNEIKKTPVDVSRKELGDQAIILASLLIYLNRTCFNGLYRLNRRGEFNVPMGAYKNPQICNADNLRAVSEVLKRVEFYNTDFQNLKVSDNDKTFFYIDPPYRALPNTPSFTSYFNSDFGEEEQINLAKWLTDISNENTYLLISNSDPHNTDEDDNFFQDNYQHLTPVAKINKVYAKRNINSKATKRGQITELLIKNY